MRNRANVSKVRTSVKKIEEAIRKNDAETARQMLPAVAATIDKAVTKKAVSKNSASRRKSSLARRINALG
jgi:small subunit ribosomal protein S20